MSTALIIAVVLGVIVYGLVEGARTARKVDRQRGGFVGEHVHPEDGQ